MQLHELEELRLQAYESLRIYKERMNLYHDKKLVKKVFSPEQFVLLFNSKWSRPFRVKDVRPYAAVEIEDPVRNIMKVGWSMVKG